MKEEKPTILKRNEPSIFADWASIEQRNNPVSIISGEFNKKSYEKMMIELQNLFLKELRNERNKTKEIEKESIKMVALIKGKSKVIENLVKRIRDLKDK